MYQHDITMHKRTYVPPKIKLSLPPLILLRNEIHKYALYLNMKDEDSNMKFFPADIKTSRFSN
jgi:hypothetical protein